MDYSKSTKRTKYRMTVCQARGCNLFQYKQSSKRCTSSKSQQRCFGGCWWALSLCGSELNSWKKSITAETHNTHIHTALCCSTLQSHGLAKRTVWHWEHSIRLLQESHCNVCLMCLLNFLLCIVFESTVVCYHIVAYFWYLDKP